MDSFVERRLARVVAAAPSGDVFLMMDETRGSAGAIPFDRVIRYREEDLGRLGFPRLSLGSLFWYNADYPFYYFRHLYPDYDVVVCVEYDAVPTIDIDGLVADFRAEQLDLVGHAVDDWFWADTLLHFYKREQIRPYQICAAILSARAIDYLAECRLRHARAGVPNPRDWPIGEIFVGTELALAGFKERDLSSFGRLTRYDWWPPVHELQLPFCNGEVFVHPVLNGRRYLVSLFRKKNFRSGVRFITKALLGQEARQSTSAPPA